MILVTNGVGIGLHTKLCYWLEETEFFQKIREDFFKILIRY